MVGTEKERGQNQTVRGFICKRGLAKREGDVSGGDQAPAILALEPSTSAAVAYFIGVSYGRRTICVGAMTCPQRSPVSRV